MSCVWMWLKVKVPAWPLNCRVANNKLGRYDLLIGDQVYSSKSIWSMIWYRMRRYIFQDRFPVVVLCSFPLLHNHLSSSRVWSTRFCSFLSGISALNSYIKLIYDPSVIMLMLYRRWVTCRRRCRRQYWWGRSRSCVRVLVVLSVQLSLCSPLSAPTGTTSWLGGHTHQLVTNWRRSWLNVSDLFEWTAKRDIDMTFPSVCLSHPPRHCAVFYVKTAKSIG